MNAIILAAGKGERLLPLTINKPKPLIEISNERIIERQINFLREIDVQDITIVAGYLYYEFLYLLDKYENIEIVKNDEYENSNNFYSLFLVKDRLKKTWIIEGDIFLFKNIFLPLERSVYYTSLKKVNEYEWFFDYGNDERILSINIADRRKFPEMFKEYYNILMGVSFWNEDSCQVMIRLFEDISRCPNQFKRYKKSYWDQLIYDNLNEFDLYIHSLNENDWYEIDSVSDLHQVINRLNNNNIEQ